MANPLKLGELLVQEKVITPHQLEEALKYQVIFGGKLGTNLIELDFVREDDIAKTLSKMLRVPLVTGDELNDIPEDVIRLIPRDMAEQYQAIPLHMESRKLTLVMANPADLKAIDEIAFRTGFIVRPAVAPEVRLILALEHYYNIPREIRYVQVSKKVESELKEIESQPQRKPKVPTKEKPKLKSVPTKPQSPAEKAKPEPVKQAAAKAEAAPAAKPEPAAAKPMTIEFEEPTRREAGELKSPPATAAAPKAAASAEPVTIEPAPAAAAAQAEPVEAKPQAPPPVAAEAKEEKPEPREDEVMELLEADIVEEGSEEMAALDLPEVYRHLADPSDREDIAESVASFVGQDVDRCAIFQVRGDVAQGWRLVAAGKTDPDFAAFQVTLDHPSILKTVTDTASYYIGPIPSTSEDNQRLIEAMGGDAPSTALLVPIMVMSRVVTVLYVDDKKGNLAEKLVDLQTIAAKMAMSFEILILKNKILMT